MRGANCRIGRGIGTPSLDPTAPLQVVAAIRAALEPANDDGALCQVDIIPAEIAGFGDSETVAVDH
jgi:hypothetical protein